MRGSRSFLACPNNSSLPSQQLPQRSKPSPGIYPIQEKACRVPGLPLSRIRLPSAAHHSREFQSLGSSRLGPRPLGLVDRVRVRCLAGGTLFSTLRIDLPSAHTERGGKVRPLSHSVLRHSTAHRIREGGGVPHHPPIHGICHGSKCSLTTSIRAQEEARHSSQGRWRCETQGSIQEQIHPRQGPPGHPSRHVSHRG